MANKEKYVDESWKQDAVQEKERLKDVNQSAGSQKDSYQQKESPIFSEDPKNLSDSDAPSEPENEADSIQVNFLNYITSLVYQTMVFLGELPNPMSNTLEKNLQQAKLLIDTLLMLREKTSGNLTKQEEDMLNATVYELQMKYVEVSQGSASHG